MMALADILSARAESARAAAQIDCGALGTLTLEALPLRDLERLSRGADADRALFYAACRDLQRTGAALLKAGKVYRPDQVTALVSDAEAKRAADAVRRLSGYAKATEDGQELTAEPEGAASVRGDGQDAQEEMSEIRLEGVQENSEVRQESVRQNVTEFGEIRLSSVQTDVRAEEGGQASREFLPDTEKEQISWQESGARPQNVVSEAPSDGKWALFESETTGKRMSAERPKEVPMHENESDSGEKLHETKSDFAQETAQSKHEIKSEFTEPMHESESELTGGEGLRLHERESENAETMHEIKSEKAGNLHETESERAERVARELLEGLRRAAWVR